MSIDDDQAQQWGVQVSYEDALGQRRDAPDRSIERVVAALDRGEGRAAPDAGAAPVFVPVGRTDLPERVSGRGLVLEDGTDLGPVHQLPPDLPAGLHALHGDDGPTLLAVHPPTCWRPDDLRAWGWALQLHSDRSQASWGHGDLADATTIGAWSVRCGGRPLLLLSPLHAPNLASSISPSPYFASSRCFWNPLYLRIADVPGAPTTRLADLDDAGRARNAERVIDRDAVWALKRQALERIWWTGGDRTPATDPVLDAFAAFTTALELHGERWSEWPADLRHPDGTGWRELVAANADRIAFHRWVQRLVGDQLAGTQSVIPLVHDLAIGTDPSGFDAWYWQDLFVLDGTRIGAPPDQFNTMGQDWALPPIDPWRLRAAGYEPFIRMLRAAFSHGSGLRVDHVMGLFRQFWIPPDESAAEGVYVRQPAQELLALLALESQRAQAFVVGEDLGTVEPGVRETLGDHHVLSYRVMALDDTPVEEYPVEALASFTTHDLPTCAGFWTGTDLADQDRLGMEPNVEDTERARQRLAAQIGVDASAPVPEVARRAYAALARAPSRIVVAQLEDAAGVAERPNMPGTTDEWPNWSLALPEPIEAVLARAETGEISHLLAEPDDRPVR
jgi:4-alpha-glucanotransferase